MMTCKILRSFFLTGMMVIFRFHQCPTSVIPLFPFLQAVTNFLNRLRENWTHWSWSLNLYHSIPSSECQSRCSYPANVLFNHSFSLFSTNRGHSHTQTSLELSDLSSKRGEHRRLYHSLCGVANVTIENKISMKIQENLLNREPT